MKVAYVILGTALLLGACSGDGTAPADSAYAYVLQKENGIVVAEKDFGAFGSCVDNATATIVSAAQQQNKLNIDEAKAAMGLHDWALAYQSAKAPPASASPAINLQSGLLIKAAYDNCSTIPHAPARH